MPFDAGLCERVRNSLIRARCAFEERKMFGGVSFLVNGHMCCGVANRDLVLRLSEQAVTEALREPHVRPMDFTGKPMKSMIYVAATGVDREDDLNRWLATACAYANSLPAKEKKA